MNLGLLALVGVLNVSTSLAQSAPLLSDSEVDAAIAAAKQQRFQSLFIEAHGRFLADFTVVLQGPIGRTMDLAREAFESYKPLAPSDVPKTVRLREVTVRVIRHRGSRDSVRKAVILPAGATSHDEAIQPRPARPRTFSNGAFWRDTYPRTWRLSRFGTLRHPLVLSLCGRCASRGQNSDRCRDGRRRRGMLHREAAGTRPDPIGK